MAGMKYIGCDPGFTGAIALLDGTTGKLTVMDMPVVPGPKGKVELNMYALHELLTPPSGNTLVRATLEHVHTMPNQGISSAFRFGEGYGALQMALAAHQIPVDFVRPAIWKKHFKLSRDKGVSRGYASNQFPKNAHQFTRVKDDGRAEAALIALYGMQLHKENQ